MEKYFLENLKCLLRKALSSILLLLFVISTFPAFANIKAEKISIPKENGWINETYQAPKDKRSKKERLIINIKDAHCNYSAQKNLYRILSHLIENYGVKLIGVEGGVGYCGLSYLREEAPLEKRREVAEDFLKQGKISGEEYLDIVSDYDVVIWGIEEQDLYDKNIQALENIQHEKGELASILENLNGIVRKLQSKIFNKDLLTLIMKEKIYNRKKLKTTDFIISVVDTAKKNNIDIKDLPNLLNYVHSLKEKGKVDFEAVDGELNKFVNGLYAKLNKNEQAALNSQIQAYSDEKISSFEFYNYLENLAGEKKFDVAPYTNLDAYFKFNAASGKLDEGSLYAEMNDAFSRVKHALAAKDADSLKLLEIMESISLLKGLTEISLSPSQYKKLQSYSEVIMNELKPNKFLDKKAKEYGIELSVPSYINTLHTSLSRLKEFYTTAFERDEAFMHNILAKMDFDKQDIACVITGGFHSDNLSELFKEQGCDYIVVTPLVTEETDMSHYLEILKLKSSKQ